MILISGPYCKWESKVVVYTYVQIHCLWFKFSFSFRYSFCFRWFIKHYFNIFSYSLILLLLFLLIGVCGTWRVVNVKLFVELGGKMILSSIMYLVYYMCLHQFLRATVTGYHKQGGLCHGNFSHALRSRKVEIKC